MAVVIASNALSDEEFLAAIDSCCLPLSCFRHGDHLRFAWLQLHNLAFDDALVSIRNGIRKFASHHNAADIYHETITTAWVNLLASHTEESFAEFIRMNEPRLTRELLHRFWTPSTLNSELANSVWLPPDREPLPARQPT